MGRSRFVAQPASRFADNLQATDHCILTLTVRQELGLALAGNGLEGRFRGIDYVEEIDIVTLYIGSPPRRGWLCGEGDFDSTRDRGD